MRIIFIHSLLDYRLQAPCGLKVWGIFIIHCPYGFLSECVKGLCDTRVPVGTDISASGENMQLSVINIHTLFPEEKFVLPSFFLRVGQVYVFIYESRDADVVVNSGVFSKGTWIIDILQVLDQLVYIEQRLFPSSTAWASSFAVLVAS